MESTSDTQASASQLGSARNGHFSEKSRLLKDERGQMVQLPPIWAAVQTDFELLEICGEGSFGRVVKARHRSSKKEVAIKQIGDAFDHQYSARKVLREIQILRKLTFMKNNVFTTKLYDILTPGFDPTAADMRPRTQANGRSSNLSADQIIQKQLNEYRHINLDGFRQIFMVIEFIESDLKKILNSVHRGTILEEDHIVTMMYNSFCALNYIHSANLLHRDLKPGNLLVDSNCCVRLCDFGLARSQPARFGDPQHIFSIKKNLRKKFGNSSSKQEKREFDPMDENQKSAFEDRMTRELETYYGDKANVKKRCLSSRIVSRWYRSPEVILTEKEYGTPLDIWSLGCILAETLTCSQLYVDHNLAQLGRNDKAKRQQFITKTVKERFFFEGNSCYPISPVSTMNSGDTNMVSSDDQIIVINDKFGKLNKQDLSFITNENIRDYQMKVQSEKPKMFEQETKKKFNSCSKDLAKLVVDTLEYNPHFRPSAKECLQNPIFDDIRVPLLEREAPETITSEIDDLLPIDYDTGRIAGLTKSPEVTAQVIQYCKIELLKEISALRRGYRKK